MKLDVLNKEGKKTGRSVELSKDIFGIEPNDHAMYLSVKSYLANHHQGTHKAKERSEVHKSTRKVHRQKGTGGARIGDIKSPLLKGGGRVFGPKPHDYKLKVNKKVGVLARNSALSYKAKENNIIVLEDFVMDTPKTKEFKRILGNLGVAEKKTLLVLSGPNSTVVLSGRNLPKSKITTADKLNLFEVMNSQTLILNENSVKKIEELYLKSKP